jgi:hypothetical protein
VILLFGFQKLSSRCLLSFLWQLSFDHSRCQRSRLSSSGAFSVIGTLAVIQFPPAG